MWKLVPLLSIVVALTDKVHAGLCGLQCPSPSSGIVPCNPDCVYNHGGNSGTCDPLCNCICDVYAQHSVVTTSINCKGNGSNIAASLIFNTICVLDCQCNHATVGGTCDFVQNACKCGSSSTNSCPVSITNGNIFGAIIANLTAPLVNLGFGATGII